jgi:methylenetetrahydrofolate--tRNA-(uracil-5-)-methyltransferase
VVVAGGGLAGTEAAWQLARQGLDVVLYEMRPVRGTPAHQTDRLAELVCSNSLGSRRPDRAAGMLKTEMRRLGSLILEVAEATAVPAGGALAVDREGFAAGVTAAIEAEPRIQLVREELRAVPEGLVVLATGPLTSEALAEDLASLTGREHLFFYDALAPVVTAESIVMTIAFRQSRYDRGERPEGDYINCPMDRGEYEAFVTALLGAERIALRDFERDDQRFFEGCLPIEVIAGRSPRALAFGPMRPVGLTDPRSGRRPYAVVQLRQDDAAARHYNLVGFQTNLSWPEQRRVLRMIPGLAGAEFVRLGQMHRNTFLNAPVLLDPTLCFRFRPQLFAAGQITGIEGYTGNAASGLVAGVNAARLARGQGALALPPTTMLGALCRYVSEADPRYFQPMKAAFGLLPELAEPPRNKGLRYQAYAERGEADLADFLDRSGWLRPAVPPQASDDSWPDADDGLTLPAAAAPGAASR